MALPHNFCPTFGEHFTAHTAERIAVIVKGHKDAALVFAGLDDDPNAGGCAKAVSYTHLKGACYDKELLEQPGPG